jgi:hypothetical protein
MDEAAFVRLLKPATEEAEAFLQTLLVSGQPDWLKLPRHFAYTGNEAFVSILDGHSIATELTGRFFTNNHQSGDDGAIARLGGI